MSNQESKRWSAAEEAMKFSLNEHFLFPFFLEGLQNSRTSESEHKNFSQVRAVLLIKVCYCLYFIYYAIKPSHNSFFFFLSRWTMTPYHPTVTLWDNGPRERF